MAKERVVFCCLIGVILFHLPTTAPGQTNSWTNSASGNWKDSYWSLGILPGTNQTILFTNDGNKTLTIGSNTVQNFPGTLNVNSITISSPPNSFNTLLLNSAGTEIPLKVQSVSVESNSAITMVSSALELDGPNGVGMQVGGEFNQNDSLVSGRQVNVGYTGPGVYNLNSGILAISNLWVGGSFEGVFNQTGGTNNVGIVGLDPGGTYNFSGGDFNATIYFNGACTFHQTGGDMNQALSVSQGTYLQSGGTNFGWLSVGSGGPVAPGNYVLSNGCCLVPSLNIGTFGTFHQFGGTQIITNGLYLAPDGIDYSPRAPNDGFTPGGVYWLSGGTLLAGSLSINYRYTQDGGTNIVTGDIVVTNFEPVIFSGIQLKDGLLTANNITLRSEGALQLMGGRLIVNNLATQGQVPPSMASFGPDINLIGGELMVSNIDVEMDYLAISGTTVKQTGTLTLGGISTLLPGAGTYTFGPLIPNSGVIIMGTNVNCQLRFADSSSQARGSLIIRNWSGSIYGGGSQQIFFGTNAAGLTADQLSGILFENIPVALPPSPFFAGVYQARILATGEIVPDTGAPLPSKLTLACSPTNSAMQLNLSGDIGRGYNIEVSTDLVNWTWWTNELNSNGTICIEDQESTNYPQRFYRASPAP